MNTDTHQ